MDYKGAKKGLLEAGRDFHQRPFWTIFVVLSFLAASLTYVALATYVQDSVGMATIKTAPTIYSLSTSTTSIGIREIVDLDEETKQYAIRGSYPVFGISELDFKIKELVDQGVYEVKRTDNHLDYQNSFTPSFESVHIDPELISFKFILDRYEGGSHGRTEIVGINYSISQARFFSLSDALLMIGMGLDDVAEQAKKQLDVKLDKHLDEEGLTPVFKNYSTFIIKPDSVSFIFQQYQVASYLQGMPEVSFARNN